MHYLTVSVTGQVHGIDGIDRPSICGLRISGHDAVDHQLAEIR
jgi:hypothetical protein